MDDLNVPEFQGSSGWLQRFKEWYNNVCRRICGEKTPMDGEIFKKIVLEKLYSILYYYPPMAY